MMACVAAAAAAANGDAASARLAAAGTPAGVNAGDGGEGRAGSCADGRHSAAGAALVLVQGASPGMEKRTVPLGPAANALTRCGFRGPVGAGAAVALLLVPALLADAAAAMG
jgi:hypothetical protein